MWKFLDFFVIQILRGLNLVESRSSKNIAIAIFECPGLGECSNFQLSKSAKIHKNENSEPQNVLERQILHF